MTTAEARRLLSYSPAYTKHKQRRKQFWRNSVVVLDSRHQFETDLIDMRTVKAKDKYLGWVLVVIDCFSKRASCHLIERKGDTLVREVLVETFQELGVPEKFQTDKDKEFYCKEVSEFLRKSIKLSIFLAKMMRSKPPWPKGSSRHNASEYGVYSKLKSHPSNTGIIYHTLLQITMLQSFQHIS